METKDWIIMLVPILVNGIILFIFQKLWEVKIEKKKNIDSKKQAVRNDFKDIAMKAKKQFLDYQIALRQLKLDDNPFELMDDFIITLDEISRFCVCYETILIEEKPVVHEIYKDFTDFARFLNNQLEGDDCLPEEEIDIYVNYKMNCIDENFTKLVDLCFNK